jgi:hypothetical protein
MYQIFCLGNSISSIVMNTNFPIQIAVKINTMHLKDKTKKKKLNTFMLRL